MLGFQPLCQDIPSQDVDLSEGTRHEQCRIAWMIPAVCARHALGKQRTTTPCKSPAWVYIDVLGRVLGLRVGYTLYPTLLITWRQIDLAAGRADGELLVAARALRQAAQVGALDARARGGAVAQRRQVLLCGLRAAA